MAYDEDLSQNKFFVQLQEECPQLYETASVNRFMILVPRAPSLRHLEFSETLYLDHVIHLVEEDETLYKTLSDKEVTISGSAVTTGNGFSLKKQVEVLFEETFFNQNDESFRVLCLSRPLEGATSVSRSSSFDEEEEGSFYSSQIRNIDDCAELLFGSQGKNVKSRRHLDNLMDLFNKSCERLQRESLRHQVDAANALYTRAMTLVLKISHLKRKTKEDEVFMDSVKLAVETYILQGVYSRLFNNLSGCVCTKDSSLNKITRNLKELQLKHLNIRRDFMQNVPRARKELTNLNNHATPLGKLNCVKRLVRALSVVPRRGNQDSPALTTDDLLPILVYLVVKAEVPNWWANLTYMKYCRFSKNSNDDEYGFYLATLEAALEHVTSGELDKIDLNSPTAEKHDVSSSPTHALWSRQDSSESDVNKLLQYIRDADLSGVASMLNDLEKSTTRSPDEVEKVKGQLCHPLCACAKCARRLNQLKQNHGSNCVTVFSRGDQGVTVLHVAATLTDTLILESLIQRGAVVNATDYTGRTALHVACQRGRQGAAFMLLHYKSDVNLHDNDGNSALHLATSHGHEDCVKALVYYDQGVSKLDLSAPNDLGDTALHLAARWGFESIVQILLENGAATTAENRRRQTPLGVAHNNRVARAISDVIKRNRKVSMRKSVSSPNLLYNTSSVLNPRVGGGTGIGPDLGGGRGVIGRGARGGSPVVPTPQQPNLKETVNADTGRMRRSSTVDERSGAWQAARHTGLTSPPFSPTSPLGPASPLSPSALQPRGTQPRGGMAAIREMSAEERNIEKLLKYTADGDIEMVKFELGWTEEDEYEKDEYGSERRKEESLCHPLCQCSKCQPLQKIAPAAPSGLHLNISNSQGFSPVHVAALHAHTGLVELFLRRGATAHLPTGSQGSTPLHLAVQNNKSASGKVVQLLVDHGCDVNARDFSGNTPLHYCCLSGNNSAAKCLLEAGCSVNTANARGSTALHEVVRWNNVPLVVMLLNYRASTSARNKQGVTPMQLAQGEKVLRLLCEASIQQSSVAAADTAENEAGTPVTGSVGNSVEKGAGTSVEQTTESRRISVRDIFSALEEPDVDRLLQVTSAIHTFHATAPQHGDARLKPAESRDRSAPRIDHHVHHLLAIKNYKQRDLRHVTTRELSHVVVSDNTRDVSDNGEHVSMGENTGETGGIITRDRHVTVSDNPERHVTVSDNIRTLSDNSEETRICDTKDEAKETLVGEEAAKSPNIEQPAEEAKSPNIEQPAVEAKSPNIEQPAVEAKSPNIEQPAVEAKSPNIEQPAVEAKSPNRPSHHHLYKDRGYSYEEGVDIFEEALQEQQQQQTGQQQQHLEQLSHPQQTANQQQQEKVTQKQQDLSHPEQTAKQQQHSSYQRQAEQQQILDQKQQQQLEPKSQLEQPTSKQQQHSFYQKQHQQKVEQQPQPNQGSQASQIIQPQTKVDSAVVETALEAQELLESDSSATPAQEGRVPKPRIDIVEDPVEGLLPLKSPVKNLGECSNICGTLEGTDIEGSSTDPVEGTLGEQTSVEPVEGTSVKLIENERYEARFTVEKPTTQSVYHEEDLEVDGSDGSEDSTTESQRGDVCDLES